MNKFFRKRRVVSEKKMKDELSALKDFCETDKKESCMNVYRNIYTNEVTEKALKKVSPILTDLVRDFQSFKNDFDLFGALSVNEIDKIIENISNLNTKTAHVSLHLSALMLILTLKDEDYNKYMNFVLHGNGCTNEIKEIADAFKLIFDLKEKSVDKDEK